MLMETKKKIMDAAFKLFADKGILFSLNEVAREVGIQKPSIYAHFTSKEDLLDAVIEREANEYYLEINEQCQDLKSMYYLILHYYDASQTRLFFWKRLLLLPPKSVAEMLKNKVNVLLEQRFKLVERIISSDMETGMIRCQDADAVAFSFFSMINGLLSNKIIYESKDLAQYYESIWQIFWNGIS
jgi:AcrR family transcriptional regulator